ncbi:hypothetical protein N9045_01195 [bacterium]|nr:hypothetical protein [bacterium]
MALEDKHKQEAEGIIEGLLQALDNFSYLPNQYKHVLPAIENAQEFLGRQILARFPEGPWKVKDLKIKKED